MAVNSGPDGIVQDGLVFYIDAANTDSYVSGSSDTFSLANLSLTGSLKNNTSFISSNAGVWDFDGSDDYVNLIDKSIAVQGDGARTISAWVRTSEDARAISTGSTGKNNAFNLVIIDLTLKKKLNLLEIFFVAE